MQRTRIGYGTTEHEAEAKDVIQPSYLGEEDRNGRVEFKVIKKEKKALNEKDQRMIQMLLDGGNKSASLLTEYVIEERLPAFLIALM